MRIKFSLTAPVLCMLVYPCGRACAQWAQIASPTPGSQLPGIAVTFTWNAISGADAYWLDVGTALALGNICGGQIAGTSSTCSRIPTQPGVTTIYVQLWTHSNGAWQTPNQYTYTAPAATAAIQSPTPGSQLPGIAVTFTWNTISGADSYWLDVGTALALGNVCGGQIAGTSSTCSGIPTQPGVTTIYVQLWTHSNGAWQTPNQYTYAAPGDFTVSMSPVSASAAPGKTAQYTVTVNPIGGFSQPVFLTALAPYAPLDSLLWNGTLPGTLISPNWSATLSANVSQSASIGGPWNVVINATRSEEHTSE